MLFNSIDFAVFLPIVFAIYWLIPNSRIRLQNAVLLIASYVFYGWWDWRFLSLIIISSLIDYVVGLAMHREQVQLKRKLLLLISLCANLGLLGYFKYFNFFAESFVAAFTFFNVSFDVSRLNIILPVGISFYTFQTLSYSIDIYRRKLEPTQRIVDFFAFVSFFPQLVAGPIERASNLLPQFNRQRHFSYELAVDGLRQILWGLFKKIVIADNCAVLVNLVFADHTAYSGSTLLLAAVLFAFQIYGDFSGYSDIATGTARLFGFNLMQNFAFPYFSRDIAEFWRRWHISLSSWFRDYLYIPLGGSRGTQWKTVRNIFVIFLVSGFWHGANWTFLFWGFLHALYFLPLQLASKNRQNLEPIDRNKVLPGFWDILNMGKTFFLVVAAWIFFRADSISTAFDYIVRICSLSLFSMPEIGVTKLIPLIAILIVVEWINRHEAHGFKRIGFPTLPMFNNRIFRWSTYHAIILLIILLGSEPQTFIYFQF
ncbi:MAG: MBOAT family protein [Gammaproteobacteria bacterium]|nr:MBOAT family protein [Gammaproteobacteria bacterium]MDH5262595.1 MBOAT family protein [Gammaproteobacteria bacterium]